MSFGFDIEFIDGFWNENTTQYVPMQGVGRYPIHPYFSKKLTGVKSGGYHFVHFHAKPEEFSFNFKTGKQKITAIKKQKIYF